MTLEQNQHLSVTLMTITNKQWNQGNGSLYGGAS